MGGGERGRSNRTAMTTSPGRCESCARGASRSGAGAAVAVARVRKSLIDFSGKRRNGRATL